jgi:hypothetical protein
MALICLMLSGVLSVAQAPAATQQNVVDELKAIRATLEKVETSQRMLMALLRIQIDEGRLPPLESEWRALTAQEQALSDELGALKVNTGGPRTTAVVTADGDPASGSDGQAAPGRYDEVARRVEEARRNLRTLEKSIADVRARIAAWEKFFQELMR